MTRVNGIGNGMVMNDVVWAWQFDQRIPSDPESGVAAIRQLLDQLELLEWSPKSVFGIHMAMEEAVMNAIKHGNKRDPSKHVHVIVNLSDTQFYAQVTDQGLGFDPDDVPDPTLEENLEKTSGRGLMLMKNFVDTVQYNEIGNSVELTKVKEDD